MMLWCATPKWVKQLSSYCGCQRNTLQLQSCLNAPLDWQRCWKLILLTKINQIKSLCSYRISIVKAWNWIVPISHKNVFNLLTSSERHGVSNHWQHRSNSLLRLTKENIDAPKLGAGPRHWDAVLISARFPPYSTLGVVAISAFRIKRIWNLATNGLYIT